MNFPNPTKRELAAIQRELLQIERDRNDATLGRLLRDLPGSWPLPDEHGEVPHFPSLNLQREYITPCGHTIQRELSGVDYLDAVLLKERRRADSLAAWVWILAITNLLLLFAFILTARSAMR